MPTSAAHMYEIWAPADSPWSVWAKPVLFTYAAFTNSTPTPDLPTTGNIHARDYAVIVDLPGQSSVLLGLALAQIGFQPVPLYNATHGSSALVNMERVADQLAWGAELLEQVRRRPNAPPVFLMNSDRNDNPMGAQAPGRFDNRWCVVPQDMPSAEFLIANNIREVLLVSDTVRDDLAHILHRYQKAGIALRRAPTPDQSAQAIQVPQPRSFGSIWYRLGVLAGFRRNAAGGFGGMTPDPSTYSGGG